MASIFITGSADDLGYLAAKHLIAEEHQVLLHACNAKRAQEALDQTAAPKERRMDRNAIPADSPQIPL